LDTIVLISRAHAETAFNLAQKISTDGSVVHMLFIGRGTHHLSPSNIMKKLNFAKLYTFETEFDSPNDKVKAISYKEFVKLLEKCDRVFTWI
jgi:predicted peroxiredoxin